MSDGRRHGRADAGSGAPVRRRDLDPCFADVAETPLDVALEQRSRSRRRGVAGGSACQFGVSRIGGDRIGHVIAFEGAPAGQHLEQHGRTPMSARLSTVLPRACSGAM
jgi:hypothetical protein